ncbi:hypothetical protein LWI29_001562 [Acer saccharum]|uniref:Uncharacterized protein n=1 Tax=Acer saccharum TaxID=4024 RepID=A0AA39STS3_ACESA|nr:hypothetical protein LWI29_001562 [Acer saccharum]
MTPHALVKFACFCDKKRSPLKSFTVGYGAYLCNCVPEEILNRTIPILANVVDDNDSSNGLSWSVQQAAACCLRRISCRGDGRLAIEISQSGAIHSLLRLLPESDHDFRRILCIDIDEGGLSSLGGLRFLVEAARFGSMVSRERACQAIGLLGVRRCTRHRLVELGVIPVLVELFRVGDSTTKLVAGNSLGVILSHVDYIGEGDNESEDVTADVFCDLSDYKHSIPVVISSGAIPILVNLLSDGNVEVRERVSGAIAKLSYDEADRVALADVGAVPLMIDVLHDESEVAEELRDITKEADINFSEGPSLRERISVISEDGNDQTTWF